MISGVYPRVGSARDIYIHANSFKLMARWSIVLHFIICPRHIKSRQLIRTSFPFMHVTQSIKTHARTHAKSS